MVQEKVNFSFEFQLWGRKKNQSKRERNTDATKVESEKLLRERGQMSRLRGN